MPASENARRFESCMMNALKYGHDWKQERDELREALQRFVDGTGALLDGDNEREFLAAFDASRKLLERYDHP